MDKSATLYIWNKTLYFYIIYFVPFYIDLHLKLARKTHHRGGFVIFATFYSCYVFLLLFLIVNNYIYMYNEAKNLKLYIYN